MRDGSGVDASGYDKSPSSSALDGPDVPGRLTVVTMERIDNWSPLSGVLMGRAKCPQRSPTVDGVQKPVPEVTSGDSRGRREARRRIDGNRRRGQSCA
jgi:hypothetical protein